MSAIGGDWPGREPNLKRAGPSITAAPSPPCLARAPTPCRAPAFRLGVAMPALAPACLRGRKRAGRCLVSVRAAQRRLGGRRNVTRSPRQLQQARSLRGRMSARIRGRQVVPARVQADATTMTVVTARREPAWTLGSGLAFSPHARWRVWAVPGRMWRVMLCDEHAGWPVARSVLSTL